MTGRLRFADDITFHLHDKPTHVVRPGIAYDCRETALSDQALGVKKDGSDYIVSLHLCDVLDAIRFDPKEGSLAVRFLPKRKRDRWNDKGTVAKKATYSLGYGDRNSITYEFRFDANARIHHVEVGKTQTNTFTVTDPSDRAIIMHDIEGRNFVYSGDVPDFHENRRPVSSIPLDVIPDYVREVSGLLSEVIKSNDICIGQHSIFNAAAEATGRMMRRWHINGPFRKDCDDGRHVYGREVAHGAVAYAPVTSQLRKSMHRAALYQLFASNEAHLLEPMSAEQLDLLCQGHNELKTNKNVLNAA